MRIKLLIPIAVILLSVAAFGSTWSTLNQADFDEGTYNQTFYNSTGGYIQLNNSFAVGTYISKIFDSSSSSQWDNISWVQYLSSDEQLPDNQSTSLMNGNVVLLHFNNGDGENSSYFFDSSYSNNNATCTNCPVSVSGKYYNGTYYDGGTDYVEIQNDQSINISGDITISVWVKFANLGANGKWHDLFTKKDAGNAYGVMIQHREPSLPEYVRFYHEGLSPSTYTDYDYPDDIPLDTWQNFVFTYNGTHTTIYVNGTIGSVAARTGNITTNNYNLLVGGGANGAYFTNGTLDDFAVWNRSLSADEVLELYNGQYQELNVSTRSCSDSNCSGTPWNNTYTSSPQVLEEDNNTYFQYKTDLYGSIGSSPYLYNLTINYTTSPVIPNNPPNVTLNSPANNTNLTSNYALFNYSIDDVDIDPYTKLLMHFDGTNGQNTTTDEFGNNVTMHGNSVLTTSDYVFGNASVNFSGDAGDYVSVAGSSDWDFGIGDFTIDWWEYRRDGTATEGPLARDNVTNPPWLLGYSQGTTQIRIYMYNTSLWDMASGRKLGDLLLNQWVHYAVVRSGNDFYAFQNGTLQSTWTSSLGIHPSSGDMIIGMLQGSHMFNGTIDELRVSKGIARWTSNFTPPSAPYTTSATLLNCTLFSDTNADPIAAINYTYDNSVPSTLTYNWTIPSNDTWYYWKAGCTDGIDFTNSSTRRLQVLTPVVPNVTANITYMITDVIVIPSFNGTLGSGSGGNLTGSGTTSYIAMWSSSTSLTDSLMYYDNNQTYSLKNFNMSKINNMTDVKMLSVDIINSTHADQGIQISNPYYVSIPSSYYLDLFNGKFLFNNTGSVFMLNGSSLNVVGTFVVNHTTGLTIIQEANVNTDLTVGNNLSVQGNISSGQHGTFGGMIQDSKQLNVYKEVHNDASPFGDMGTYSELQVVPSSNLSNLNFGIFGAVTTYGSSNYTLDSPQFAIYGRADQIGNSSIDGGLIGVGGTGTTEDGNGNVFLMGGGLFQTVMDNDINVTLGFGAAGALEGGSGYIENGYSLIAIQPDFYDTGQVENLYGVYIEDHSGIGNTDSYNLYSEGASSENYFEGEVEIGGISGDGTGKAVCIKADGYLGTCTDAVNATGYCTCA